MKTAKNLSTFRSLRKTLMMIRFLSPSLISHQYFTDGNASSLISCVCGFGSHGNLLLISIVSEMGRGKEGSRAAWI